MEHISVQPVRSFVSLKAAAARKKVFVSVGGEGDDDEGREEGQSSARSPPLLPPSIEMPTLPGPLDSLRGCVINLAAFAPLGAQCQSSQHELMRPSLGAIHK